MLIVLLIHAVSISAALLAPRYLRSLQHVNRACPQIMAGALADEDLPITPLLPSIVESLRDVPNLVLQAPPGAGKTTAMPLALLRDATWREDGVILVLEPRRVAARGAALRMASLLGERVGGRVGYSVRGERVAGRQTRLLVVTEGILLRRIQDDPSLESVAAIIFDEFHERSVEADTLLALCREVQLALRPRLRLVVTSATLGGDLAPRVSKLLGGCPVLTSEGRAFPVNVVQLSSRPLLLAAAAPPWELEEEVCEAVLTALRSAPSGDLLVFLPGEREIRGVERRLERRLGESLPAVLAAKLRVLPLYGALPFERQKEAIDEDPDGRRRVVLATSIAESSITIRGVRIVIDCGLHRRSCYDANTGMAALVTRPISKSSATQRAGRAGRVAPGTAYRLWSESEQLRLVEQAPPEMVEADLAPVVLSLARWGCVSDAELVALPWLDPPPAHSVERARDLLVILGALSASEGEGAREGAGAPLQWRLTTRGRALAALPAHPRLAHALLTAFALEQRSQYVAVAEKYAAASPVEVACALVALIEERDVLEGGARTHGCDARPRLRAILSSGKTSDPLKWDGMQGVNLGAWKRARATCAELCQRVRRAAGAVVSAVVVDEDEVAVEGVEAEEAASDEEVAAWREGAAEVTSADTSRTEAADVVPAAVSATSLAAALQASRVASKSPPSLDELSAELSAACFFERCAQRQPGKENTFLLANGRQASFASSDEPLAQADYLVALAIDGSDKRNARLQLALPLTLEQLLRAVPPAYVRTRDEAYVVPSDGSVRARRVTRVGALEVGSTPLARPTAGSAQMQELLLQALRERGLRRALFGGDGAAARHHPALEVLARVRLMRALDPSHGWPLWTERSLLETAANGWLAPALQVADSLKQLARTDTAALLLRSLPYELQRALDEGAPVSLEAPSGSRVQLLYVRDGDDVLNDGDGGGEDGGGEDGRGVADSVAESESVAKAGGGAGEEWDDKALERLAPVLACKLQEWFGATETPTVGSSRGRRLPVQLQLLSPAGRPLAVTSDLPSFWSNGYLQARAELRDKYKKHPWPEDPASAVPTRLTNNALRAQAAAAGEDAPEGRGDAGTKDKKDKKVRGKKR
jgi:ATP-dependent helicase HrpB